MATAKKAAPKKTATQKKHAAIAKAAPKAAAAAPAPELKAVTGPVTFNKSQAQNIKMIGVGQARIMKEGVKMIDIAADIGRRLIELKDVVKKQKHGWKEWVQEGNLPFSYEQANRYSKLAAHPKELTVVKNLGVTSIEEAVKQIEYIKKPEKQAAAEEKAAAKAAAPAAAPAAIPATINAAFDMLQTFGLDDLREIQSYIADRIEELQDEVNEAGGDDIPGTATEVEDDADIADAVEVAGIDPLS